MDTWMVTLTDPDGNCQRVQVRAPAADTEDDIREFILRPDVIGTKGEKITLEKPHVIGLRKLRVTRPHNTVMPAINKAATV